MGKLREKISKAMTRFWEWGFKREAARQNRELYDKYKVEYKDGDNT
jgi:hypothetical protein|tara:strand:- start:1313 stop:1450 length:138 start_codon:yes stop_codon:yes gene_type:complete